jgi:hypothetical protein
MIMCVGSAARHSSRLHRPSPNPAPRPTAAPTGLTEQSARLPCRPGRHSRHLFLLGGAYSTALFAMRQRRSGRLGPSFRKPSETSIADAPRRRSLSAKNGGRRPPMPESRNHRLWIVDSGPRASGSAGMTTPERAGEPNPRQLRAARRIMSAAFSPIMIAGALVLPEVRVGMIEASATRRPSMPRTQS